MWNLASILYSAFLSSHAPRLIFFSLPIHGSWSFLLPRTLHILGICASTFLGTCLNTSIFRFPEEVAVFGQTHTEICPPDMMEYSHLRSYACSIDVYWDEREPCPPGLIARLRSEFRNQALASTSDSMFHLSLQIQPKTCDMWLRILGVPCWHHCPLQSHLVFVVHDTATMVIKQVFRNESPQPIEKAAYAFPIPNGCTLTDLSYRIGDHKSKLEYRSQV